MIFIKKAGELAPTVAQYLKDDVSLKAYISPFDIESLLGSHGKVTFGDAVLMRGTAPDVLVGPDSIPSLSFTSGSEGKPKGVYGRHFSLTYYYPWMSEKFDLSRKDRFAMLSGIAHDPIQRDSKFSNLINVNGQFSLHCILGQPFLFLQLTTSQPLADSVRGCIECRPLSLT